MPNPDNRETINFQSDDINLTGWLYLPDINEPKHSNQPHPAIIMTHGFSALKEHNLDQYAQAFAEAGFAVLLYDHRCFGESQGRPRQSIDPALQIKDYQAAITYLSHRPDINADRIAVWGVSYSGGHVLVLGAIEPRICCVIAQTPFVSGEQATLKKIPFKRWEALEKYLATAEKNNTPIPIIPPKDPHQTSLFAGDNQALSFFTQQPQWQNSITPDSLQKAITYEPHTYAPHIQKPTLMITTDNDRVTFTDLQQQTFDRITTPKQQIILPGGHFSPLLEQQSAAITATIHFLQTFRLF